ncbi:MULTISPECIES: hypothetical protein [Actinomadura]|uniref:Mce-associated membrane protein n=1 Tax=Actinomadura yumaensis TaxID=111807 RepID=A0ABW2CP14_9ACTN|nr:hypothetical protein [Actinomadura sp. J1-007]MWK36536.1 hypothetical protein [Actinomadura sp. J1-007]
MTAKTTKGTEDAAETDVADADAPSAAEVEAPGAKAVADETGETGKPDEVGEEREAAAGPAARPAKRKRRVRVIEVIDDEDLDEVLEAIDAEDDDEEAARPAKPSKPAAPKPAAKRTVERIDPPAEDDGDAAAAGSKGYGAIREEIAAEKAAKDGVPRTTVFGLGVVPAVVVVVLVALLASLAIWQWTSASDKAAKEAERKKIVEVATGYGDTALSYNASNYQSQMEKAQKYMGGDLLESYKQSTLPNLGNTFKSNPQLALSSKTGQVFVGSVDGKFATAVVMADIGVTSKDGTNTEPSTLIRLALAKIDGKWKVTKIYASGQNDSTPAGGTGQNGLPGTGGTPSGQPSSGKSEKPKN